MREREINVERAALALRREVRDGVKALKLTGTRWTNERIAEEIGVDAKTVQRWENVENTIRRRMAAELDARWPEFFPNIMGLLGDLERSKKLDRTPPVIRLGESPVQTYREIIEALEAEPRHPDLRTIRHCAFHGILGEERRDEGGAPRDLQALLTRFGEVMTARIAQGWHVRTMFTVGTEARLEDRVTKVAHFNAASLEVRAFLAGSVPLIAPLIIGDTAFIATDHQRWNRAEAAMRFEGNTSLLQWLHRYFDMLWDRAPYRLRTMAGPSEKEFGRLRRDLRAALDFHDRLRA